MLQRRHIVVGPVNSFWYCVWQAAGRRGLAPYWHQCKLQNTRVKYTTTHTASSTVMGSSADQNCRQPSSGLDCRKTPQELHASAPKLPAGKLLLLGREVGGQARGRHHHPLAHQDPPERLGDGHASRAQCVKKVRLNAKFRRLDNEDDEESGWSLTFKGHGKVCCYRVGTGWAAARKKPVDRKRTRAPAAPPWRRARC